MSILVIGFSIKALMPEIAICLPFPRAPGSDVDNFLLISIEKTIRNLLPRAPGPDRAISSFSINNQKDFAPGSPGAGSGEFPIHFLLRND